MGTLFRPSSREPGGALAPMRRANRFGSGRHSGESQTVASLLWVAVRSGRPDPSFRELQFAAVS